MSKFYDEIALYYNDIFPMQKVKLNLILEFFDSDMQRDKKHVLDVACATGEYARAIANLGYQVTAVDLDEKMVKELRKKEAGIDARVMNMLDISQLDQQFDLIYCLGNSIVHLDTYNDVENFFSICYQKLKQNGRLLFQIINYSRILDQKINCLPTIFNREKGLSFVRDYVYLEDEHKIGFHTILQVNNERFENTVKLLPIRHEELYKALEKAGFHIIKTYGDFTKNPFDVQNSVPCIMIAEK